VSDLKVLDLLPLALFAFGGIGALITVLAFNLRTWRLARTMQTQYAKQEICWEFLGRQRAQKTISVSPRLID
jgi:hypothetical protein